MRHDVLLARYGEIGLKSRPVRRRFEQALQSNIEHAFESRGLDVVVTRIPGRFLLTSSDLARAAKILSHVFGLTSVSPARIVPSDLGTLLAEVPRYLEEAAAERPGARTFALRVRRSGQHPYTSQELARQGGATVLAPPGGDRWSVDLGAPDVEVSIEVRDRQAFLFHDRTEAPGGLPVGTQGKVIVLVKDLNSLVAAWLMLKRGCTVLPVAFAGPTGNVERARALLAHLQDWHFATALLEIPHEEVKDFDAKAACVLCMRQMIRKADLVARRKKAKAIVTGESFASTTVDNLTQFGGIAHVPLLRPLLGMTPQLVAEFAQRIGLGAGRHEPFAEPCPFRVRGRIDEATLRRLEDELGQEARAYQAVRTRAVASVPT